MNAEDKLFYRILRTGGLRKEVTEALIAKFASNGGSTPDSWLHADTADGGVLSGLPNPWFPQWADPSDPPARGTDITIDTDTTRILIAATGKYDVSYLLNVTGGADPAGVQANISYNDDSVGPFYYRIPAVSVAAGGRAVLSDVFPKVALTAGDVLRLQVSGVGVGVADSIAGGSILVARVA